MKIRDKVTRGILGGEPLRSRERSADVAGIEKASGPHDRIHISDRGVEIRHARSLALAAPDIREELVEDIVEQIKRGEYRVTGAEVVPRMIRDHLALA